MRCLTTLIRTGYLSIKEDYLGSGGQIRTKLIQNIHSSQNGDHSGVQASVYRAKQHFLGLA